MCLAIPMQIDELESPTHGTCASEGVRQPVDLTLIDTPTIGDYVIVHAGFAIERLDPQEAAERIAWFQQIAASNAEAAP
jgi:hydrogenase expression/formation protein HypC